ncbi:LLM class flavin-dependent oxidoreductase, partial [Leucobacter soli]
HRRGAGIATWFHDPTPITNQLTDTPYVTIDDSLQLRSSSTFGQELPPRPHPGRAEGRLDALLVASWVAPRTTRIGLIPTVTTTHTEPFHVATALQTLDHISLGRAGWQLRFSAGSAEAAAFGRRSAPEIDLDAVLAGRPDAGLDGLIDDAADAAEVARRLWDSWESDAIIRDVANGRFLDRDRLHHIDFASERLSVIGPSIVPGSPQGQLPITLLAHSAHIFALAARTADVVFITPENDAPGTGASRGKNAAQLMAEVRAAEAVEDRAATGLAPLRIVADLVVGLDTATEPGSARLRRLDDLLETPSSGDARIVAGSAEELADLIAGWHEAGVEGVRLRPLALPDDLERISSDLLPSIRARIPELPAGDGIGVRLRDRFGLPPAINRYTRAREERVA